MDEKHVCCGGAPTCMFVQWGSRESGRAKRLGKKREQERDREGRGAYLYGGYVIRQCWVARAPERQESASQGLPSRGEKIKIKSAWKAGVVSAQTCAQSSRAQV